MSDFKTMDLVNAMADHLERHDWQTQAPAMVFRCPMPPGNIIFPCLAVYAVGGTEASAAGYGQSKVREAFQWTLAESLGIGDLGEQYQRHLRWRDEVRGLQRRAIDNYWGLGGVVTLTGIDPVWESEFFQLGDEGAPMDHLVATTLKMEVEYREQF